MASLVKDLVEAGVHFGHRATHWNPKMAPYIYGKRNKIHIIDVKETIKGLLLARKFITKTVSSGRDVLFVGTKRQARGSLQKHVSDVEMHWVTERWLGGTLTNFRTIRERLKRLEELERIEESGDIANYSKKMESQLRREKSKILRNLEGIRNMNKLPGAMIVIDPSTEHNAVKEARKLGIPTICLIDTDSDPDYADIPIPGNDDAMRAIEVVVTSLCAAVAEGKSNRVAQKEGKDSGDAPKPRRRSNRAQFSASASGDKPAEAKPVEAKPVEEKPVEAKPAEAAPAPAEKAE
ncbi:30S ribosomal protein S2 [Poriferisphaera corsica]|uniref:Small ribosomal subunit protein uS2 n=1 Tax=Poriferisphaera corsica TaxID=2528020 RepID=A0A517YXL9_9BACT|nr:30S ribosomal protein S2 [Poriferisphaera corsica]QDU34961.1 30S ribosomal protein S2 [Poriferisphaera corsica]